MRALAASFTARSWEPASAIGPARDVLAFERGCGYLPRVVVRYELMVCGSWKAGAASSRSPDGLVIGRASIQHAGALYPLQEAYEREEVLTPIHRFDAVACRVALERSVLEQVVLFASEGGRVVGKAGTNARGLGVDQIGGVFIVPDRRGRGIGRALMEALLDIISSEGRRAVLFVKPDNVPAIRLYRALGFATIDDFRADYFEA
jgi:predicted GNAT family acetyltransferase